MGLKLSVKAIYYTSSEEEFTDIFSTSGWKQQHYIIICCEYSEYMQDPPYHFVDTEQEFQALVKGLRPKD